jgi:hypothetical protein
VADLDLKRRAVIRDAGHHFAAAPGKSRSFLRRQHNSGGARQFDLLGKAFLDRNPLNLLLQQIHCLSCR